MVLQLNNIQDLIVVFWMLHFLSCFLDDILPILPDIILFFSFTRNNSPKYLII